LGNAPGSHPFKYLEIFVGVNSPETAKVPEVCESNTEEPKHSNGGTNGQNGNKRKNAVWIKLAILIFILAITFTFYKTGFFQLFLNKGKILSFLESLGPLSFLGFILLQAAQVVLAPIPGEVTGLIGGYAYGPFWGVIVSTVGLVLGSFVAFELSRAFGRPFVEKFVNRSVMERFDYLLHHKGLFLIFLLFLMPGFPKDYFCFILGLGHLTTLEFLVISSVGRLMGTILLTLGGGYIRYHQYRKLYVLIGVALIVFLIALAFRNRIEEIFKSWQVGKHENRSQPVNTKPRDE
jgi:uncharacterized membrane protein YdjX (TVP38/TMEM64 family)